MKNRHLLKYVILFSICILVSGCTGIDNDPPVEESMNPSDVNLTLGLMPTELSIKEINELSTLQLTLKNEGNYTVNVAILEEFSTYNIIYSNGSDIEYEHMPALDLMGDESLVELKPNESLSINVNPIGWNPFSKGNHSLSAKYFVRGLNTFTKPYWEGVIRSNNITLRVE
ncbi:hypothetical protein [Methanococcoides burtonii]|uniref:Lipoprotein n=1 Tax=Methanococcoides burtonii (strain DSM 6242 / NBRC 107633 / OCM 468 / ACE-M) TaxID=259564 RepID=Q12W59_METBU|nr:hypothetical protein [Methanococcoides burtonii]ABE52317.1 Hypothetical protein Mbur_1403 [Methanococcoides burtonii DSM 6242]